MEEGREIVIPDDRNADGALTSCTCGRILVLVGATSVFVIYIRFARGARRLGRGGGVFADDVQRTVGDVIFAASGFQVLLAP